MTTVTLPATSTQLCTSASAGANLGTETTTFAAGNTIAFVNTGNVIVHLHITTSGTGTVNALSSGNNVSLTLTATGDCLLGPFPQGVFGSGTVTITTATAVGSGALYVLPTPSNGYAFSANALHNPFETSATAADY